MNYEKILQSKLGFSFKESLNMNNVNKIKKFNPMRYAESYKILSGDEYVRENTNFKYALAYKESENASEEQKKSIARKLLDTVKDVWKFIKVLVGKLIIFIEETISIVFDKSRKVEKLINYVRAQAKGNAEVEVNFTRPAIYMKTVEGADPGMGQKGDFDSLEAALKEVNKIKTASFKEIKKNFDANFKETAAIKTSQEWKDIKKDLKEISKTAPDKLPEGVGTNFERLGTMPILNDKGMDDFIKDMTCAIYVNINRSAILKEDNKTTDMKVKLGGEEIRKFLGFAVKAIESHKNMRKLYFNNKKSALYIKNMPSSKIEKFDAADLTKLRKILNKYTSVMHKATKSTNLELAKYAKCLGTLYKEAGKAIKEANKK